MKKPPKWYRYATTVMALGVFASTLFVKQHVLVDVFGGIIVYEIGYYIAGKTITFLNKKKELQKMRSDLQIVFQDPYSSLSPRIRVIDTIIEPMEIQKRGTKQERIRRAEELLEIVGLEKSFAYRYPHDL